MLSPYAEKKSIYKRLEQLEKITNPTNDKFTPEEPDHPLCEERDRLLSIYWEYMKYELWFKNRTITA